MSYLLAVDLLPSFLTHHDVAHLFASFHGLRSSPFFPVKVILALITPAVLFKPPDSGPDTALGGGHPARAGYAASCATRASVAPP
jgi:hypothetical protein